MTSTKTLRSLEKYLVTPNTVAQALIWQRRPILSIHLGESSIDLAVLSEPSRQHPIHSLPSIAIESESHNNTKYLKPTVLKNLSNVVQEHQVCGLVVSWPLHKEGWAGAPCGRVLHALDQIISDTNIVTPNRPMCLWDGHHFANPEDPIGNVDTNAAPPTHDKHQQKDDVKNSNHDHHHDSYKVGHEHYHEEGMHAAAVAADYLSTHWPELAGQTANRLAQAELEDPEESTLRFCDGSTELDHKGPLPLAAVALEDQHRGQQGLLNPNNVNLMNANTRVEPAGEIEEFEESLWFKAAPSHENGIFKARGELESLEDLVWNSCVPLQMHQPGVASSHAFCCVGDINSASEESLWIEDQNKKTGETLDADNLNLMNVKPPVEPAAEIEESEESLWLNAAPSLETELEIGIVRAIEEMASVEDLAWTSDLASDSLQRQQLKSPDDYDYVDDICGASEESLWMTHSRKMPHVIMLGAMVQGGRIPMGRDSGEIENAEESMWITSSQDQNTMSKILNSME